jgi:hypothetical protein
MKTRNNRKKELVTSALGAAIASVAAPALLFCGAATAQADTSARFVGDWHVHGASLAITETTATFSFRGSCSWAQRFCSETDAMAVASADDQQVTLAVTAVTYTDETGASVPNPNPGPATAVGDSVQLVWQAPGLLKQTVLQGFPGSTGGNPYWCGAGISQTDLQRCGA